MGLDLSFYRVNSKEAQPFLVPAGAGRYAHLGFTSSYPTLDRDESDFICDAKVEVVYQRKNHYLKYNLSLIYPNPGQCDYILVTKLQAYHLLHVMKQNAKYQYDNQEYYRFKRVFEQALRNFDWENDLMFWSWV